MTGHDEVAALEESLRAAMLTGNVNALSDLLDDTMVFTNQNGAVLAKADDLAANHSGQLTIERFDV